MDHCDLAVSNFKEHSIGLKRVIMGPFPKIQLTSYTVNKRFI